MADFFDHLWDQFHEPSSQKQRVQYRERIKTLIPESPPPRLLGPCKDGRPRYCTYLKSAPDPESFQSESKYAEVFLIDLANEEAAEAGWFRQAKLQEARRPFWRKDPLKDEIAVLESRAMGADAYCLSMSELDQALTQFLVELGRDYGFPAILLCQTEEELARALQIKDLSYYWLCGELVAPQLLELDFFRGKTVIFSLDRAFHEEAFQGHHETRVLLDRGS